MICLSLNRRHTFRKHLQVGYRHWFRFLFEHLQFKRLVVNASKYVCGGLDIELFWNHITAGVLHALANKRNPVKEFPQTGRMVRKYLGLLNFYCRFIGCPLLILPPKGLVQVSASYLEGLKRNDAVAKTFTPIQLGIFETTALKVLHPVVKAGLFN